MKRSLLFAVAVLLIAALFVSCNANKVEEDQLVEISISADNGRTLEASGVIDVDIENLIWFYEASKTSGGFKTGQTSGKKAVKAGAAAGLTGASLGQFSKGSWVFKFYGYDPANVVEGEIIEGAKPIFQQLNCPATFTTNYTLSVTLERGEGELPAARVQFNELNWFHVDFKGEDHTLVLNIFVEGETTPRIGDIEGTWDSANGKATFTTAESFTLTAASTLSFRVYEGEELIGLEQLLISATPGMVYTVSVSGDASGITPVDSTVEVTIDVAGTEATIPLTTETAISVKSPVAPDKTAATNATSVTFPAGSFNEDQAEELEYAVLNINVKDVEEASTSSFEILSDDTAIGAINLHLGGSEFAIDTFNGKDVIIVTYISPGLEDLKVMYNGEGTQPIASENEQKIENQDADVYASDADLDQHLVGYSKATGKLVFMTKHFSDYVVSSDSAVAYNARTKVIYSSIQDAIDAATAGDTIRLLKSTSTTSTVEVDRDLTIDGVGKTLTTTTGSSNAAAKSIVINEPNVTVVLKNLTTVETSDINYGRGIQLDASGIDLTIDHCEINAMHYAINFWTSQTNEDGANNCVVTIRDSQINGWGALNIWSNGLELNAYDSTFNGYNDKVYDAAGWNGFGTIVLEGDTTKATTHHSENCELAFYNCRIISASDNGNSQSPILFNLYSSNNVVKLDNCSYSWPEVNLFCRNDGEGNELIIDGSPVLIGIEALDFNTEELSISEEGKTATGTISVTYGNFSQEFDLSDAVTSEWSDGTDYVFEDVVIDDISYVFDFDISYEYEDGWTLYLSADPIPINVE